MADSTPQPEYYLHLDLTEGELEPQQQTDATDAFLDFSVPSHEEANHQDISEQDNQWPASDVKDVLDGAVSVAGQVLSSSTAGFDGLLGTQVTMDTNTAHWNGPQSMNQVYGSLMDMELNKLSPPEQVSGCITPDLIFPSNSLQNNEPIAENNEQEEAENVLNSTQLVIPQSLTTSSAPIKQAPSGISKKATAAAAVHPTDIRRSTRARRQSSLAAQSEEYLQNAQVPTMTATTAATTTATTTPIPAERVTRSKRVYCYCQKPDDGEVMIQCDNCRQWFHGACVDITDEVAELMGLKNEKFFCDPCTEKLKVRAKSLPSKGLKGSRLSDARDCALPTCLNEARATNDYCSEECAIKGIELEASQAVKKEHKPSAIVIPTAKTILSHSAKKLSSPVQPSSPLQLKSPGSPKPEQNPVRSTALKGLGESLMVAFDTKADQKETDAEHAGQLAIMIEKELYMFTATPGQSGCGKDYKAKYRSLFFNLKDKNNESLRARVLSGELEPHELVRLTPEELANPELQSIAEEVRKRSIHDSVLTIEQEPFIKKTHKGDVSYIPGPSMNQTSTAPNIEPNSREPDIDTKPSSTKGTPEEKSVEEMIQEQQSSNKSTPAGSPTTEALDKLLARIQTNKRSGEEILNDALSSGKRQRQTEAGQDGSSYLPREPSPYSPSPSPLGSPVLVTTTPPGSPPPFMLEEIERNAKIKADASRKRQVLPIWQGTVEMDQVAKVFARAVQVGGSRVIPGRVSTNPTADMVAAGWADILTRNVTVEGRIPIAAVESYVAQQRQSVTKEVLIVRFELNSVPTGSFEQRNAEFEKLFRYFHEKSRNGVIPNKARQVKDMYLVPIGANDPLPRYFQGLVENEALVQGTGHRTDALFGVLVVNKASSHHHRHGQAHGQAHGHGHSPSHPKSSSSSHRRPSITNSSPYPVRHDRHDSKDSQSGGYPSLSHPPRPQALPAVVTSSFSVGAPMAVAQQHSVASVPAPTPAPVSAPAPTPAPMPTPSKPPSLEELQGLVDQLFHSGKTSIPAPGTSTSTTQGLTPAAAAVTAQLASGLIAGLPASVTMNLTQAMAQLSQQQQQPQPQQSHQQPQGQHQSQGQQQPFFARPPPPPPGMPIPPPGFLPLHSIPQHGQRPVPPMPPIPPHQLQAFLAQQYGQKGIQGQQVPPLPPLPPGFIPPPPPSHLQIPQQQYQPQPQQQPQRQPQQQHHHHQHHHQQHQHSQDQFRSEDPRKRRDWS
ncbi:PHD finger protein 3 [Mortierella sp. AM989]|nr:PHD finger protein 3 [Mortierella sp. AM989]